MESPADQHRLSAIMFTDIVGYTKKMGDDEVKMLRLLRDHDRIVRAAIEEQHGDIIKGTGDGFLVRFDGATNAVLCAIAIQQAFSDYNTDKANPDQIVVRIGIHLGDIVIREGDVFGDGVNVAARVQPLAQPGGICITRAIYDVVHKKMEINAVELGPQQLKHVDEAVEVFHLLTGTLGVKEIHRGNRGRKPRRRGAYTLVGTVVLLIGAGIVFWRAGFFAGGSIGQINRAMWNVKVSENRVAVLPLRNLTGSDANDYICEGMAQDLISRMAAVKDIYVYPMENVLALDEKQRTFEGIRNILGASYLIRGTLEMVGDSLAIATELISTKDGKRLWREHFVSLPQERITVQQRLAQETIYQITARMPEFQEGKHWLGESNDPIANDLFQQTLKTINERFFEMGKDWDQHNIMMLKKAIEADTLFVAARIRLANDLISQSQASYWYDDSTRRKAGEESLLHAQTAVRLAPNDPDAHGCLGDVSLSQQNYIKAEAEFLMALKLRPTNPAMMRSLGFLYRIQNKSLEAIAAYSQMLQLSADLGDRPSQVSALSALSEVSVDVKDYKQALLYSKEMLIMMEEQSDDSFSSQSGLALKYDQVEDIYDAMRDYTNAREYSLKALECWNRALEGKTPPKDRSGLSWGAFAIYSGILRQLANTSAYLGDYQEAIVKAEAAAGVGGRMNESRFQRDNIFFLTNLYYLLGETDKASALMDSLQHAITDQSDTYFLDMYNLFSGLNFLIRFQPDSAQYYFQQALQSSTDNWNYRSSAFLSLGIAHYLQNHDDSARIALLKVVDDSTTSLDRRFNAKFYLGAISVRNGDTEVGLKQMATALDSTVIYASKVAGHRVTAEVMIQFGRPKDAAKHLDQGLAMAKKPGMKGEIKRFEALQAKLKSL